jgi:glycosyltransferase involved in cell wall biosynthesis
MTKKIALVTTGHPPLDERIYWKFGLSISSNGYETAILSSTENINTQKNNISIIGFKDDTLKRKAKLHRLYLLIYEFKPDLIICFEASAIIPAYKYKKSVNNKCKIVSDITEWYPHRNTLGKYKGLTRAINYIGLYIFNIYATNLADYLFIGEKLKKRAYTIIAPTLKKQIIGYYSPKRIFNINLDSKKEDAFTICFSGTISKERGFHRFITVAEHIAITFPMKRFIIKVIGNISSSNDIESITQLNKLDNIKIALNKKLEYPEYAKNLLDSDICIDMRDRNIIFNRSLPISLFDYMAAGKPVIFSYLDVLKDFPEIKKFGILIEPEDIDSAINQIRFYLENPTVYKEHSAIAKKMFNDKYNWESLEKDLIKTIKNLLTD